MAYKGNISYEQAWQDLKDMLAQGDIENKDDQTMYVADLQKCMDEIEIDNRD